MYKDGACTLRDGSVVIWSPDQEEECEFVLTARMSGYMAGGIWLSDSKEFSLSWNDNSSRISDCYKQLIVTDQGYAVQVSPRTPRHAPDRVGLVTSNQLSAQLLAAEGTIQLASLSVFRHALLSLCVRTNTFAAALASAIRMETTLAMRYLLKRQDIAATHLGGGYVQVRRCVPVPPASFRLVPFNDTCYSMPKVEIDTTGTWPPRASVVPMAVLSLEGPAHFFVTQIPVRANGVHMLALIDTGAGITVASQSLLPLLGIFRLSSSMVSAALGMAGIPVRFVGCAPVLLQIGTFTLQQVVHFTEKEYVPRAVDTYNLILGNDILQRLPFWALDYAKHAFLVGKETVPIISTPKDHNRFDPPSSSSPSIVRAATTVVLHPGSEGFVPCYVADSSTREDVTWMNHGTLLSDDNILVAPGVFQPPTARLYLSNPTESPHIIYKDQHLTTAQPVLDLPSGTLVEPPDCF
ncbi:unnamed protein product [Heligmosomoides polygyrus]|uniref:Peptidase A2 domain-containing protein n=1 Tax=Heligmosomoides polygyrus TaxID=6339 RepID=A0A183G510_HELPZ|nr:unnamed protein product [Heligmosomoides polygyrus]